MIELLISIVILGIILIFAAPSFKNTLLNNRMLAQVNSLMAALNFARLNAIEQNIVYQVCPFSAPNSTQCGTNWQNGWVVLSQTNNGQLTLIQSYALTNNVITVSSPTNTGNISFSTRGVVSTQANFKFCDSRGSSYAQSLELSPTGFIQSSSSAGVAVWDGSALSCP